MKKLAVGIVAVLGLTLLQAVPAKAAGETIVIIDTVLDTSRPELKSNIVHEVCITESRRCSNQKSMEQEGPGAASLQPGLTNLIYSNKDMRHGTDIALTVKAVDPNARIIFIRTTGVDVLSNGRTSIAHASNMKHLAKPLNWVAQNKSKYNIAAVVMSKASNAWGAGTSCVPRKDDEQLVAAIKNVTSLGIAVMAGTGNDRNFTRTRFPSCVQETISVSSVVDWQESIDEIQANHSSDVDFYALGFWNLPTGRTTGTSLANAALAAYWVKNYKGSYQATYDYLKSISKPLNGGKVSANSFIDIKK
jgi:hypothetical protein